MSLYEAVALNGSQPSLPSQYALTGPPHKLSHSSSHPVRSRDAGGGSTATHSAK